MKEIIRALKYVIITAAVFLICFFCFTTGGIDSIYSMILQVNSGELEDIEKIIVDKADLDSIRAAKMILVGQSGDAETDINIQRQLLDFLSDKTDANCVVLDISNSEAGLLNAYLDTGNEEYYLDVKESTANEQLAREAFYEIMEMLYAANMLRAESDRFYFAGLANEENEAAQLKYLHYLIYAAAENPLNDTIRAYIDTEGRSAGELAQSLSEGITGYPAMFREHFLTLFSRLEFAVATALRTDGSFTGADAFNEIYRGKTVAKYIMFLNESMINPDICGEDGFINRIYAEIPLFEKRSYTFDCFIYGTDYQNVRLVNSNRMKYADKYTSFVYGLSGKSFAPAEHETSKYYVRIG